MIRVNRRYGGGPGVWASLVFVLLMTACNIVPQRAAPTQANHLARVYTDAEMCKTAVTVPAPPAARGFSAADNLDLLSWNIHKGEDPGWREDLKEMARETELVLLQEALLLEDMKQPFGENAFWSFSPGYQADSFTSGVMTASRVSPDLICSMQTVEPWLNTPKAASILRFPIQDSRKSILLVNMHSVNFALGMEEFSDQIDSVVRVLKAHRGPVVLSGDFNTWKDSRMQLLTNTAKEMGLTAVEFTPDHRTQWFGNYLDYIFIRGFEVKKARIPAVTSSDHNPLKVTLELKEDVVE